MNNRTIKDVARCVICNCGLSKEDLEYSCYKFSPEHKDKKMCKDNLIRRLIDVQAKLDKLEKEKHEQQKK